MSATHGCFILDDGSDQNCLIYYVACCLYPTMWFDRDSCNHPSCCSCCSCDDCCQYTGGDGGDHGVDFNINVDGGYYDYSVDWDVSYDGDCDFDCDADCDCD